MRALAALACAVGLMASATAGAEPEAQTVAIETIAMMESRVRMPRDAAELEAYDRYYARDRAEGHDLVRGVFLRRDLFGDLDRGGMIPAPGIENAYRGSAEDLPVLADGGGCAIVYVILNVETGRFGEISITRGNHISAPAVCGGAT